MKKTPQNLPEHVAIIMDGNGRWAARRGLPRLQGHRAGVESVRAVVRECGRLGIKYLTLYAFSTENWRRPVSEVKGLMRMLETFLRREERLLHENMVRLRTIGELSALPDGVREQLERVKKSTEKYEKGNLILALNYGGRDELVRAFRAMARAAAAGELAPQQIDERAVAAHLDTHGVPDPDLLIRTSGEMRLSNFLLWQLSYAEFYFTETLWPDFREREFRAALAEYARRQRRFGAVR